MSDTKFKIGDRVVVKPEYRRNVEDCLYEGKNVYVVAEIKNTSCGVVYKCKIDRGWLLSLEKTLELYMEDDLIRDNYPHGHWTEVPRKELEFKTLTHDMLDTFIKKNADYGDSTTSTFNEFGLTSYAIRLSDKLNRIKTYCKNKELNIKDENVVDTLLDMANYCLLAIIDIRGANDVKKEKT